VVTPFENASQIITSCKTRRNCRDKYRICERKIAAKEAQICVEKSINTLNRTVTAIT